VLVVDDLDEGLRAAAARARVSRRGASGAPWRVRDRATGQRRHVGVGRSESPRSRNRLPGLARAQVQSGAAALATIERRRCQGSLHSAACRASSALAARLRARAGACAARPPAPRAHLQPRVLRLLLQRGPLDHLRRRAAARLSTAAGRRAPARLATSAHSPRQPCCHLAPLARHSLPRLPPASGRLGSAGAPRAGDRAAHLPRLLGQAAHDGVAIRPGGGAVVLVLNNHGLLAGVAACQEHDHLAGLRAARHTPCQAPGDGRARRRAALPLKCAPPLLCASHVRCARAMRSADPGVRASLTCRPCKPLGQQAYVYYTQPPAPVSTPRCTRQPPPEGARTFRNLTIALRPGLAPPKIADRPLHRPAQGAALWRPAGVSTRVTALPGFKASARQKRGSCSEPKVTREHVPGVRREAVVSRGPGRPAGRARAV